MVVIETAIVATGGDDPISRRDRAHCPAKGFRMDIDRFPEIQRLWNGTGPCSFPRPAPRKLIEITITPSPNIASPDPG
jgi:hypothetical protein